MKHYPIILFFLVSIAIFFPQQSQAHRSGCHTLHTCQSDSSTYVCGDLGYPCDGSTSLKDIAPNSINVPLLVEATFSKYFTRKPSEAESSYWKKRFRSDKDSIYKIRRAMAWHKSTGSFGPAAVNSRILVKNINDLFRTANLERNPTITENQYWISRIPDKLTEQAMKDAMIWHRINGLQH